MKTVGDLYDAFKAIEAAEKDVENEEKSLTNGGSPDTIKRKEESLRYSRDYLSFLRSQRLDGDDE